MGLTGQEPRGDGSSLELAAARAGTDQQPGWYADPVEADRLRYFDGAGWTDWVQGAQPTTASRPPARRLALVAAVTAATFGTLSVGAIWLQSADLAHASTPPVVTAAPVPSSTPIAPVPSDPTATPPAAAGASLTCEDLFSDVIDEARTNPAPGRAPISIVTLHGTAVLEDHSAELAAGTLVIAPGQTEAVVLSCRGIATATDGDDYPVEFSGVVDAARNWSVHVTDAPGA
ncbi:DUF2510 domain-containing protein [Cellulomonas sp. URHD0024]|uniref:DUF2510 domain-containing protein n=1 Tax=Cellulomonas sp. URHD0024 TaxID=1302620 RepID=UPI00041199BB|nr:DUF2510 domain-containing protein [Cellulomonas sp. URHD0024]